MAKIESKNFERFSFFLFLVRNLFGGVAHLVTDPASPSNIVAVKSVEGEELQLAQNVSIGRTYNM